MEKKWFYPFASHLNFLDPKINSDGTPYAPKRYRELVKECYLISKNINTSYNDLLKITPTEKDLMLEFLVDEAKKREEILKKQEAEREANRNNRRRF